MAPCPGWLVDWLVGRSVLTHRANGHRVAALQKRQRKDGLEVCDDLDYTQRARFVERVVDTITCASERYGANFGRRGAARGAILPGCALDNAKSVPGTLTAKSPSECNSGAAAKPKLEPKYCRGAPE